MQFFVVFHHRLFDECYEKIPPEVLTKYFTFFAVNQAIPKEYTPGKYNILNEWDLPIYDPTMQEKGYRENSAIYHVYANGLHTKYGRVGFFQYDMSFNENIVEKILNYPIDAPVGFFVLNTGLFDFIESSAKGYSEQMKLLIQLYEQHFSRTIIHIVKSRLPPFKSKTIIDRERGYPLLNSYVIPSSLFEKVMQWVVQLYPIPEFQVEPALVYEGVMAIALGSEDLQWQKLDVDHDQEFKKQVK
jgi:hypothetical protein